MVGQRFITLLAAHPWFVLHALGASARSAGKPYEEAVNWKQATAIPSSARDMIVTECLPQGAFAECKIVFSGLDSSVAGDIESAFRSVNLAIFSNSKNFRRDPNVPLVVPLVNTHHLAMIPQQQRLLSQSSSSSATGFIVTNANCSTTGIVVPIHALEKAFGPVDAVVVSTMQAISGAGYPGLSAMDVMDNVVPYIDGEEEKVEWEMLKILGGMREASSPTDELGRELEFDMRASTPLRVSASCNRVPVIDGHTACVSIRFARRPPPSPQQVREALSAFIPALPSSSLFTTSPSTSPSSSSITSPPVPSMFPPSPSLNPYTSLPPPSFPSPAIVVHSSNDRPQPRLDRYAQDGACVHVGRVRQCPVLDVKFVVLANNVSLGAASGS